MSAPLQKLVSKGATSQSVIVRIQNQISFVPLTNVTEATSGLVLTYYRPGEGLNWVSFAPAALSFLSSAWTAGGFEHIVDGYYRVDVPDAAFTNVVGVNNVLVTVAVTADICAGAMVQLTDGGVISAGTPQKY